MRDNPIHVAVFGRDEAARLRGCERVFLTFFAVAPEPPRVAVRRGSIVGVAGAAPPGTCRLPPRAVARGTLAFLRSGPAAARRALAWLEAWGARDLTEPHWHVGPVAVEAGMQGLGIGGRLLGDLAASLDARGETAWLETDKPDNVAFYGRFGFEVEGEAAVLGVQCWFMRRAPRPERAVR